jgi:hypothetical protein
MVDLDSFHAPIAVRFSGLPRARGLVTALDRYRAALASLGAVDPGDDG